MSSSQPTSAAPDVLQSTPDKARFQSHAPSPTPKGYPQEESQIATIALICMCIATLLLFISMCLAAASLHKVLVYKANQATIATTTLTSSTSSSSITTSLSQSTAPPGPTASETTTSPFIPITTTLSTWSPQLSTTSKRPPSTGSETATSTSAVTSGHSQHYSTLSKSTSPPASAVSTSTSASTVANETTSHSYTSASPRHSISISSTNPLTTSANTATVTNPHSSSVSPSTRSTTTGGSSSSTMTPTKAKPTTKGTTIGTTPQNITSQSSSSGTTILETTTSPFSVSITSATSTEGTTSMPTTIKTTTPPSSTSASSPQSTVAPRTTSSSTSTSTITPTSLETTSTETTTTSSSTSTLETTSTKPTTESTSTPVHTSTSTSTASTSSSMATTSLTTSTESTTAATTTTSSSTTALATTTPHEPASNSSGFREAAQFLLSMMDTDVTPCNDFYNFACGKYSSNAKTPSGSASVTQDLQGKIVADMDQGIRNLSQSAISPILKAKAVYESCLDWKSSNKSNVLGILSLLNQYGGLPILTPGWNASSFNPSATAALIASRFDINLFLSIAPRPDYHLPSTYRLFIDEGTLILQPHCYIDGSACGYGRFINKTKLYIETLVDVFNTMAQLAGVNVTQTEIRNDAIEILKFETKLALGMRNVTPFVNYDEYDNIYYLHSIEMAWPTLWQYLEALPGYSEHIEDYTQIYVTSPDYMSHLEALLNTSTDARILSTYILWRLIHSMQDFLSPTIRWNIAKLRQSLQRLPDPQESCFQALLRYMDFAATRIYIDSNPVIDTSLVKANGLAKNLTTAMKQMVSDSTWLDQTSKTEALAKLDRLLENVAFPSWIRNDALLTNFYANLTSNNSDYFSIEQNLRLWKTMQSASLLSAGITVRRDSFTGSPLFVDAIYSQQANTINIPLAIMQMPMFQIDWPDAVVDAIMGFTVSSALSHSFDNDGAQFDADGKLKTWMSQESISKLLDMEHCLADEYSEYQVDTLHINVDGNRTQKSIFDENAGLEVVYNTYIASHKDNPEPRLPGLDGYNMEQILFIAFAALHCTQPSDEELLDELMFSMQAPKRFQVLGALKNSKEFIRTFGCDAPKQYCDSWQ